MMQPVMLYQVDMRMQKEESDYLFSSIDILISPIFLFPKRVKTHARSQQFQVILSLVARRWVKVIII
jgi:hypothetical protein